MKKSNVLITGATGYIGRNLIRAIEERYNIFALIRNDSNRSKLNLDDGKICIYTGDVQEIVNFCKNNEISTIIHLAAYQVANHSVENMDFYLNANIVLGTHCLEALKENGMLEKKFICVGTNWQHYQQEQYRAVNLYAATKEAFGRLVDYYADAYDIKAITLELYETYGAFDDRNKIINLFLRQQEGEVLGMTLGEQKLDMCYIEDVLSGFEEALKLLPHVSGRGHKRYCLSTGEYYTIREIAGIFEKVYHKSLQIQFGALPYKKREMMMPYQHGERLPNWSRRYTLEEGLTDMRERMKDCHE